MPVQYLTVGTPTNKAVCIDDKAEGLGPVLSKGRTYLMLSFFPPQECREEFPDHPAQWHLHGGRVEVSEFPGCFWFGERFKRLIKPHPMS